MPLYICYSGDAEPLLQDEEGCFGVRDQTGRQWFGREADAVPDLAEFVRIGDRAGNEGSQMWVGRAEDEQELASLLTQCE